MVSQKTGQQLSIKTISFVSVWRGEKCDLSTIDEAGQHNRLWNSNVDASS